VFYASTTLIVFGFLFYTGLIVSSTSKSDRLEKLVSAMSTAC